MKYLSNALHSEQKLGRAHPEILLGIQNGANFDIASLSVHHHLFDDHACSHRFQVTLAFLGITLSIGWVQLYD